MELINGIKREKSIIIAKHDTFSRNDISEPLLKIFVYLQAENPKDDLLLTSS